MQSIFKSAICRNAQGGSNGDIYRSIELLEVPEVFIKNFRIGLRPDADSNTGNIRVNSKPKKTLTVFYDEVNI